VGVPAPCAATVAVRVTGSPGCASATEVLSAMLQRGEAWYLIVPCSGGAVVDSQVWVKSASSWVSEPLEAKPSW
jgi:hypothetical protein